MIGSVEQNNLIYFLSTGKALYIEGNDFFKDHRHTTIDYALDHRAHVILRIYDVSGKRVRTLVDQPQNNGTYRTRWNGTNVNGCQVPTGVYYCQITAGPLSATKKLIYVK